MKTTSYIARKASEVEVTLDTALRTSAELIEHLKTGSEPFDGKRTYVTAITAAEGCPAATLTT